MPRRVWKANWHWLAVVANRGAYDRIRTGDLFLTKEVLYRLSYIGDSAS